MDFASEIPLSAIKLMICRRFSSFRFGFSVFIVVLSDSFSFIEAISSNNQMHLAIGNFIRPFLRPFQFKSRH